MHWTTWMACFALLFILSMDFWTWKKPVTIGFWGLPNWIWPFIGLQIFLTIFIFLFVRYYWKDNNNPS